MNIETKLHDLAKRLYSSYVPNRKVLFQGYKNLKAFLNCSLSLGLLEQAYRALEKNLFCTQFELSDDLLKVYQDKVDEAERADRFIEGLLSSLEDELYKEAALDKNDNQDDDLFEVFFEDLDELKSLFSCKVVRPKNIQWFFHSELFCFMADSGEYFKLILKDIYKAWLRSVNVEKKEYFMELKKVLIEKANRAMREEQPFERSAFFLILNAKKNDFKVEIESSEHLDTSILIKAKARKTAMFSPLAKQAMFNYGRQFKLLREKQVAIPTKNFGDCLSGICLQNT